MTVKTLAPIGFARNHILALREEGASNQRIAQAAAVKPGFINGIVYGDGTTPRKEADAAGVQRVLALTPADIPPVPGQQRRTPQPAAQRRVHALAALGYPWSVIAHTSGFQRETISLLARQGLAQTRNTSAINAAYQQLRNSSPSQHDVAPHVEKQCRANAEEHGWHTPHWWDEHGGIDTDIEPDVTPITPQALPDAPAKGWEHHSACRDEDPDLFFPTGYTTADDRAQARTAKEICGRCPVRELCLAAALRRGETDGIYGGTTPGERRNLLRGSKDTKGRGPGRPLAECGTRKAWERHIRNGEDIDDTCANARYTKPLKGADAA